MDSSYSWLAVYRDGTIQERWENGEEQRPAASVAEFHLLPSPAQMKSGARPYSLFLRGKEELVYFKRRHADATSFRGGPLVPAGVGLDTVFVLGVQVTIRRIVYFFVLPDGRVEISTDPKHITRFERHCEVQPLRFYEVWPSEEIPGQPGQEARWPGEYNKPLPIPAPVIPQEKIEPPLAEGHERNAREFESDAFVDDPATLLNHFLGGTD